MSAINPILSIRNLHASVNEHPVLNGIDLNIAPGEVHVIMGPNGSGKTTLANVLVGRPQFQVTQGEVYFLGNTLLTLLPEERARQGIFLAFQYPVEIPGVNNLYFLKTAVNSLRQQRGESTLDAFDFMQIIKMKLPLLNMEEQFLNRSLNEGFSGGEKKRNEMLQMLLLEPKLAILDETDSGLDIDALHVIANSINHFRHPERAILMVTHYQRLLNYVKPDYVHVLLNGRIIASGSAQLAQELEKKGYGWLEPSIPGGLGA